MKDIPKKVAKSAAKKTEIAPSLDNFAPFEQVNVPQPEGEETIATNTTADQKKYDLGKVAEWEPREIVAYYDQHIKGRSVSDLDESQLEVLARHGQIAKSRRDAAESEGEAAQIESVRRRVQEQVDRQALASYTSGALEKAITNLKNKRENNPTVEVEFRFGSRKVVVTAEDIAAAYGTNSNALSEFRRTANALLDLIKKAAIERRRKIERPSGRDFSSYTSDIRALTYVQSMKDEDAAKE